MKNKICKNCRYWILPYSTSEKYGECTELESVIKIYLSSIMTIDSGRAMEIQSDILSIDTPEHFCCANYMDDGI